MTQKIHGAITSKSVSEGENDNGTPWVRASFEIDSHKYSSFDQKVIDSFNPGDSVEVEYDKSKDGKYNNIKSMKKIDKDLVVTTERIKTANEMPDSSIWDKKDRRIAKMNALRATAEILHTLGIIDPERSKEVFKEDPIMVVKDMAEQLVEYIYND